jgi:D-psicose/D-tagatose/L-ribulose 3-epimerase
MRLGINTLLWTTDFTSRDFGLLPQIREHGFDGVEITILNLASLDTAAVRRELEKNGLGCTVCSVLPRELSLLAENPDVWKKTKQHLADCVKATADLGANTIAGPLYSPVGYLPGRRRTEAEWKRAVAAYQELGPVLESHRVNVCLEPINRFETFFLNTTADSVRFCQEVNHPRVGILWDTFHANIEEKNPVVSLESGGSYIRHIHISENDRGIPGTGHVDWQGVFQALSRLNYDAWLTIESFGFAMKDLSAAASIWRDLAPTPDDIAWQGVEFLRKSFPSN